jgi:hypothetical protein
MKFSLVPTLIQFVKSLSNVVLCVLIFLELEVLKFMDYAG